MFSASGKAIRRGERRSRSRRTEGLARAQLSTRIREETEDAHFSVSREISSFCRSKSKKEGSRGGATAVLDVSAEDCVAEKAGRTLIFRVVIRLKVPASGQPRYVAKKQTHG